MKRLSAKRPMKFASLLPLIAAPVLFLTGCATKPFVGEPGAEARKSTVTRAGGMTVDQAYVLTRRLKPGMTESQVKAVMGEPDSKQDGKYHGDPNVTHPAVRWNYSWLVYIGYRLELTFALQGQQWLLTGASWWDG